ncbi:MAG: phage tail tape measure protein [Hyphomicrobiales bacterium]|nr:phage tail tape measure protein [Hyphomicrobiales bacterium]MDE2113814.1 phage tail tape measure protein [Hyphomicrobiales bacterium]
MSQFEVSMLLKLVDEISGPLRAVVGQMEALKKATASPISGNATAGVNQQTQGIERAVGQLKQLKSATESARAATTGLAQAQTAFGKSEQVVTGVQRQTQALQQAGRAASGYHEKLSRLESQMGNAGLMGLGFQHVAGAGRAIKRPVEAAVGTYTELQKQATAIAIASDRNAMGPQIAQNVLDVARASHLAAGDIMAAERSLASVGGAKYLDRIAVVEGKLGKLGFASGTDTADLYAVMLNLMRLGKMDAGQALTATQKMYQQGKDGPFELRNMAYFIPQLLSSAVAFGETGKQFVNNATPFIQTLRQTTSDPGEAATQFQHIVSHLANKAYMTKISKNLGVDVAGEMSSASKAGADPLFGVLNKMADAYDAKVAAGANPAVLRAAVSRDFYFSKAFANFVAHRKEFDQYAIPADKAREAVNADFDTRSKTQSALEQDNATARLALAYEAGASQQALLTTATTLQTSAINRLTGAVTANPSATSALGALGYIGGSALSGVGNLGMMATSLYTARKASQWGALKLGLSGGEALAGGEAATAGAVAAETALGAAATAAAGGLTALLAPLAAIVGPLVALGAAVAWLKGKTDAFRAQTAGQKAADAKAQAEALAKQIATYPAGGGQKQLHSLQAQRAAVMAGIQAVEDQHRLYPAEGRGNTLHHATLGKASHLPQAMQVAPPPPAPAPVVKVTTQAPVTITNHITINATTNASPAAIGSAVAGGAARGTRAGMGALHDGPESLGHH